MDIMDIAVVFSGLFMAAAVSYWIMGFHVLFLNPRGLLNRLFALICLALTIWAVGYAVGNTAPDASNALLWHRIAAVGWSVVYVFTLHYFLVLTERRWFLQRPMLIAVLYVPAVLSLVFFGPFGTLALQRYDLVSRSAGWIDMAAAGPFFYAYYLGYSLLCFGLIWTWPQKSDPVVRFTRRWVALFFSVSLVLPTLTDVLLRSSLSSETPKLGIFFIFLIMVPLLYAVKRHGFMLHSIGQLPSRGHILSEAKRAAVYRLSALSYLIGSVLHLFHYFNGRESLSQLAVLSLALFVCGTLLWVLPRTSVSLGRQDDVFGLSAAVLYPLIVVYFVDSNGGNLAWHIFLLYLMIAVVFHHHRVIYMVTTSAVLTQLWVWSRIPEQVVVIESRDHVMRLGTALLAALLVFFVNRVYLQRLEENESQTYLQRMLARVSASFVRVDAKNLGEQIEEMLEIAGHHFGVDRARLLLLSEDQRTIRHANEWCNVGIKATIEVMGLFDADLLPWAMDRLRRNLLVSVPSIEALPPDAMEEKRILRVLQIQSVLAIPVINRGVFQGFLTFETIHETKTWNESHETALQIMANLVSESLVKVASETQIHQLAYYDNLTGAANRALFNERLTNAIDSAHRKDKLVGVLLLDLDGFKSINDTMGHDEGDKLLVQTAQRLERRVRRTDTVCRFGGDEFLILFPFADSLDHIRAAAAKLMDVFDQPMKAGKQECFVKASAGLSVYPMDGTNSEDLVKNADLAMYAAKEQGKNQIMVCTTAMKEAIIAKTQLSNDLHRALRAGELILHYQPQINLKNGNVSGIEALLRWDHPHLGFVSPAQFVPLAEQTGLIHAIGEWVLSTACEQAKDWQNKGFVFSKIAVNMSVEQLRHPKIIEQTKRILEQTELSAEYLELEITESAAVKDAEQGAAVIGGFRKLGVALAIDDFGTGYSSLGRLKELPIDRIKLAMEFVHGIGQESMDEAITRGILGLAQELNLRVVAEGVETWEQLDFLKRWGCDDVQGFYYYGPMPAAELERLFRATVIQSRNERSRYS